MADVVAFTKGLDQVVKECFTVMPDLLRFTARSDNPLFLQGGECKNFIDTFIVFVLVNIALYCFYFASTFSQTDVRVAEVLAKAATRQLANVIAFVGSVVWHKTEAAKSVLHVATVTVETVSWFKYNLFGKTYTPVDPIVHVLEARGITKTLIPLCAGVSGSLYHMGIGKSIENVPFYFNRYVGALASQLALSNPLTIPLVFIAWKIFLERPNDTSDASAAFSGVMAIGCSLFPSKAFWRQFGKAPPTTSELFMSFRTPLRTTEIATPPLTVIEELDKVKKNANRRSGQ